MFSSMSLTPVPPAAAADWTQHGAVCKDRALKLGELIESGSHGELDLIGREYGPNVPMWEAWALSSGIQRTFASPRSTRCLSRMLSESYLARQESQVYK